MLGVGEPGDLHLNPKTLRPEAGGALQAAIKRGFEGSLAHALKHKPVGVPSALVLLNPKP